MAPPVEALKIPKDYNLSQISRAILYQESMGFVFDANEIRKGSAGASYNHATFAIYRDGHPAPCVVQLASAPAPADHVTQWGGLMLVANTPTDVVLYRQQTATAAKTVPTVEASAAKAMKGDATATVAAVKHWQSFLGGQGFAVEESGRFDDPTRDATKAFQKKYGLYVDGKVGNQTYGQAALLGFEVVDFTETPGSGFPTEPSFAPVVSTKQRQAFFGRFDYKSNPKPDNREHIDILGDWESRNIVTIDLPQLAGKQYAPRGNKIRVHQRVAKPIQDLWSAWDQAGLLDIVQSWDGAFVPRFIRGSRTTLSNHAFGSAFDINAATNRYGAEPAWPGKPGCVFDLVPIAQKHRFYWGGHFKSRRDGMHFEYSPK